ncbi:conserved Plasmodium protein, unknown function [Plasmodium relictum]|uniref:Uncharacterized protein n=1 Tax=Plasmodium relictum TaxID=85471 RepID=A0A1J1H9X9_PLARL|nr:conserved Plasmodium protein, unknown function [Plasmodium relictum]CRH01724.1 conserved Plasmodium protein, unknown function [Plasmodium relictum]
MVNNAHDSSLTNNKNEKVIYKGKEKKKRKTPIDESLSDISISTISNSTGIDSDLYNNVLKEIKEEKKRKKKLKKRKNNNENEASKNNREFTSMDSLNEEQNTKKQKIFESISENKKRHKSKKDRKRKKKVKKSKSRSKCSYDDKIPKDPFNPLLLAYVKDKKFKYRKNDKDELNFRWKHDRYESTSNEEGSEEREQNINKALPKIDIFELRKNLWKSKAGGVCLPQISENIN